MIVAQLSDLTQGYGGKEVISGLNLELTPGVLGLLGPNGAGKTTLLRTLATILPPRKGTLEICNQPVRSEKQAHRARRVIGFLPQHFGFFPGFTVYDFIRYCAWLREIPRSHAHEATNIAMERVCLTDQRNSKLKTLSGGMLRRVGIAQAIVGGPQLLLLDEPTVGLDPAQRLDFREVIRNIQGVAVVISTHLVEDVAAVCDEVAVMDCGRIIFRGDTDDLIRATQPDTPGDSPIERGYMSVLAGNGFNS
jgi:ABC-2 type transport system ATP-binding protein